MIPASAQIIFSDDFSTGLGIFTTTGAADIITGTPGYVVCCGATGSPASLANPFVAFGTGDRASGGLRVKFNLIAGRQSALKYDVAAFGSGSGRLVNLAVVDAANIVNIPSAGNYLEDGHATIRGLVPPEVALNLFKQIQMDLEAGGKSFQTFAKGHDLSIHQTVDISGHFYRPLTTFLWGLTPIISQITGADLLPSYDYFRIYQQHDVCRVHSDRPSCEHSVSLSLVYSDGIPWPLEVGSARVTEEAPCVDSWDGEPHTAVAMQPGDAVLYRGIDLRHGRTMPNPNRWSAHLFLFWVERDGKFAQHAFDEERLRSELKRVVNFDG